MNLSDAKQKFANPPLEARPAPFWFWNDRLDPERLVWQYDRLMEAGMGGAVLHARHGLAAAEYLDERWFTAIQAVFEHASRRGGYTWLYDELGWPSGTAGGRIPREHPEYRMLHLRMQDVTPATGDDVASQPGDVVAVFHVTHSDPNHGFQRRHDGSVTLLPDRIRCEPVPLEEPAGMPALPVTQPAGMPALPVPFNPANYYGQRLLIFRRVPLDGAVNYFDRRATETFLRSTHEEYYARFKDYFGTVIRHSFMDEAGMCPRAAWLPWDMEFAAKFERRRGYSLLPHLPALFFDVPGCETVRYDYWSLAAELFREGFAIPMHEWCTAHGAAYTGHYVFEATLKEATRQLGSTMPLYEYQGLPGIDILGNDFYSRRFETEAYGYYVVTIKQAASVSHQLGKGGLMSESYGVGGNAMGPEAMQTATNFQMALGVTLINQHAAFYSLRGDRKFDCPPIIGWQEPYWRFVRKHMDATSRTGWLLSQGTHVCDVLLLHPASSMQATYRHFRARDEYKAENYLFDADLPFELIDKHFTLLSVALLDAQIDHDYGDEEIMARHASAEKGMLRVGRETYRVALLPPLVNIRSATLSLLRSFAGQGGTLLMIGSAPRLVDGRANPDAAEFLNSHAIRIADGVDLFDYGYAIDALTRHGARTVELKTYGGEDVPALKAQRRVWDGCEVLYLANVSREPVGAHLTFKTHVTGRVEEWDPSTGQTRPVRPCAAGENVKMDLRWAARQARAFVLIPGNVAISAVEVLTETRRIQPAWSGARTSPNILLLDECHIVDAGLPGTLLSISQAQSVLRTRLQQAGRPVRLVTRYPVYLSEAECPSGPFELAIELGKDPKLSVNGVETALESEVWIMDPAIRRIPLPPLHKGWNFLEVTGTYENAVDLQSPWLLGEFRVDSADNASFSVARDNVPLAPGPWPKHGLPFYASTVAYRAEFDIANSPEYKRVMLDMPGLAGSAEVRVNSRIVDHVLWPPYECDLTAALRPGINEVEIEVANTLRNLMGPHFDPLEELHTGISDKSYQSVAGQPKRFQACGLLQSPEIVLSE